MAKIIYEEMLKKFRRSGCFIKFLNYDYDIVNEQSVLKIIICEANNTISNFFVKLVLFNVQNIKLFNIEQPISELEIMDYSENGYDISVRYRLHDIENEQVDIYFQNYEISTV